MTPKFGTSGLRGPAVAFTPPVCGAYVSAFLETLRSESAGGPVYIGCDLRASSPAIGAVCVAAAAACGFTPIYGGVVPTPALAAHALARRAPAIMVTGSHIPEDYNGLKFYRVDGELLKEDEAPIADRAAVLMAGGYTVEPQALPLPEREVGASYFRRYAGAFAEDELLGLRVGVDQHSAAGRDLTVDILSALGAQCYPFRREDRFVAVDTEALAADDFLRAREQIARNNLDAVVSTDGDGDRPLLIDETGKQVNGDVLGALTAQALGIDTVVTPLTSTSGIEMSGWFRQVLRTRVGSPYVVAAMAEAQGGSVAGFEANGGFLLGSDIELPGGRLAALPTRDALLPLIAVLAAARRRQCSLSRLAAGLPPRYAVAGRLRGVPAERAKDFLSRMAADADFRASFAPELSSPGEIDLRDGVRMVINDGAVIHFRASGNAPEMRCYVETGAQEHSEAMLEQLMAKLGQRLAG